jgi:hypothetical protein
MASSRQDRSRRALCGIVGVLIATGCSGGDEGEPLSARRGDGVIFLVQNVRPNAVMDALFEGRVAADDNGCLRLQGPDPATVVWPYRATLDTVDGQQRVRAEGGRIIGTIGGTFRLGGGEVQTLAAGNGISAADAERARSTCPGKYWIVGDVPS